MYVTARFLGAVDFAIGRRLVDSPVGPYPKEFLTEVRTWYSTPCVRPCTVYVDGPMPC